MLTVGVLALQGDFAEHVAMLELIGVKAREVRREVQLHDLDGLIIPGGESTTIAKLSVEESIDTIFDTISRQAQNGMPVYGTCMGSIFLAKEIEGSAQGRLGLMDIKVRRNAFGPQKFSSEREISIPQLRQEPFLSVFIRAPIILHAGTGVNVMARTDEGIVMARQANMLVTSFHPEVTNDLTIHRYFVDMVRASLTNRAKSLDHTITIIPTTSQIPVGGK